MHLMIQTSDMGMNVEFGADGIRLACHDTVNLSAARQKYYIVLHIALQTESL